MNPTIIKILEQTLETGHISRRHYGQLISLILSNEVNDSDRSRLNQILDKLQLGQINLTN